MITFEFNTKLGILETTLTGKIGIDEIVQYYNQLKGNNDLPQNLKNLINSNKAQYSFLDKDLNTIANSIKELLDQLNSLQEAIVQTSPYETAMAMLYERMVYYNNYQFGVFSTREAAIEWLSQ